MAAGERDPPGTRRGKREGLVGAEARRRGCLNRRSAEPVNFELRLGDVVVFHADHLHASELNRTDQMWHVA